MDSRKRSPETWGKLRARDVKIIEYVNSSTTKSPEKMIYDMMFMKDNDLYVLQHRDFTEDQHHMPYCEYDKHLKFVHGHTHFPGKISTFHYHDMTLVQNNVCWDAWYRPVNVSELKGCIGG